MNISPKEHQRMVDFNNQVKGEILIHLEDIAKRHGMELDSFVLSASFSQKGKGLCGVCVVEINDDNEDPNVQHLPEWARLGRVFEAVFGSFERFREKHFSKKSCKS